MQPMTLTQVGLLLVEASKKAQKEKRASFQELLHALRPAGATASNLHVSRGSRWRTSRVCDPVPGKERQQRAGRDLGRLATLLLGQVLGSRVKPRLAFN